MSFRIKLKKGEREEIESKYGPQPCYPLSITLPIAMEPATNPHIRGGRMKFRKKPVVIEAICFLDMVNDWPASLQFCPTLEREEHWGRWHYYIPTLEGCMEVTPGDWIIRGIQGEFYPCKPDIFDATYEEVE